MLGLGSASGKVLSNSIAFLDVTALSQDNTQLRMHLSVSIHHKQNSKSLCSVSRFSQS